ncbi:MAG TPA: AAA family ATPase [Solirubrobacterales bacterium]|nr:AAA family ATPase [Solirubrobacterales bacterium]
MIPSALNRRSRFEDGRPTGPQGFLSPAETGGVHVPERFGNQVASHLILNMLNPPGLTVPLMLAVHGPPGEGKTLQCRKVFEAMGVEAVAPPAEAFESKAAGEAQRALLATYQKAGEANSEIDAASRRRGAAGPPYLEALFVNDLDQRIGRKDGAIQQTVNTQLISASLMELADNPRYVGGRPVPRVPIVITANDLTAIHPPLYRDGRMRRFLWKPTFEERAQTLAAMYPEAELDAKRAATLMRLAGYSDEAPSEGPGLAPSTATFAAIKVLLYERAVLDLMRTYGPSGVLAAIRLGEVDPVAIQPNLSYEALLVALEELRESHLLEDHLRAG